MSDNIQADGPHKQDDQDSVTNSPSKPAKPASHGFLPLLIDFGPLLVFFLVFKFSSSGDGPIAATRAAINGTAAFMVAIIIAVAVSHWKLKKVSPMLWLSAILIMGFGALTIYFNDEKFIQIKPTIIYIGFAVLLLGGWAMGKPLLRYLMQAVYTGLSDTGWMKLSRNWGLFFAILALLNEGMRAWLSFDMWLTVKVWGVTALSMVFALSQMPMLMKHGLDLEGKQETDSKAATGDQ